MSTDLVRRAQAGDHDAFAALAAAAIARLHRTARLILRDDERAGDAVQDALLRAWLDIRAVRDPDRFEAWLNRVLVRSCYREADRHRQALPPRMRAAIGLRYYLGLPVDEVAEVLDVSPNTVKSQLKTALAHLRAALADEPAMLAEVRHG